MPSVPALCTWISACATSRVQSLKGCHVFSPYGIPMHPRSYVLLATKSKRHMTHMCSKHFRVRKTILKEFNRISLLEPLGTPPRFVCPSLDRWHQSVWKPGQRTQKRRHLPQVLWASPQTSAHGVRERNHCRF